MTKKKPTKQKISEGQNAGAICLLIILAAWTLFAIFKTIPANISTLTKEQPADCQSHDLSSALMYGTDCSKAVQVGSKSGAVFGIAVDLVGIGLLAGFGPKLYKVTQQYKQQK